MVMLPVPFTGAERDSRPCTSAHKLVTFPLVLSSLIFVRVFARLRASSHILLVRVSSLVSWIASTDFA